MGLNRPLFRERIRTMRERQHRSRIVVSELCGLPPDAFRRYERGEAVPTVESMILISEYFNVSVDYLCGLTDTKTPYKRKEN